jgi:hypothetical protein
LKKSLVLLGEGGVELGLGDRDREWGELGVGRLFQAMYNLLVFVPVKTD